MFHEKFTRLGGPLKLEYRQPVADGAQTLFERHLIISLDMERLMIGKRRNRRVGREGEEAASLILSSRLRAERQPKLHLVGVGGIGMSALAQLLTYIGVEVSGSDRALDEPANSRIFRALSANGIALFPQDGSFLAAALPDALVFSTAIESDNPDFQAVAESIPLIHRADMLSAAVNTFQGRTTVAVAGSCGKTTVTAWLAETLVNLGYDPLMVGGGASNSFVSAKLAGNF
ncbi:MAG: hypothetical protein GXP32_05865 [Kiritimatiellaeota bacterium]|nr:hypothetical protein [Kiritimatiellota bacterium]